MAWAIVVSFTAEGSAAREAADEFVGARPGAEAGGRIEVADLAEVHQLAAPVAGQHFEALVTCQRVVAAGREDAGEGETLTRHRQPAPGAQIVERGVTLGHELLEIGRGCQQGTLNLDL